jgi:tetratricopeptide (TPR) repeat protein
MRRQALIGVVLGMALSEVHASVDLSPGVAAFHERRWKEALAAFLNVLSQDPGNAKAHSYMDLSVKEIQSERNAVIQEDRLRILSLTARRFDAQRIDPRPIEAAILDTTQAEDRARRQRWGTWCEEAEAEVDLGHLLPAYELVFRTLSESPNQARAQQLLSELQGRVHDLFEHRTPIPSEEHFALEGFDAFGRAEYEIALTAWQKGLSVLQQSYPTEEAVRRLDRLRFGPYWKIARGHVDEDRSLAQAKALFHDASELYTRERYFEALQGFRRLAVLNPDYPQLGFYLAQAEAAVEKDRIRRLGETRQKEIVKLYELGAAALQKESYTEAERMFQRVLALDPTHLQARSYLALAQAELHRQHDPKAAQQHYETGLIAYASGKLEEAQREWTLAVRMNPRHQKAINALTKVRRELVLNRDHSHEALP